MPILGMEQEVEDKDFITVVVIGFTPSPLYHNDNGYLSFLSLSLSSLCVTGTGCAYTSYKGLNTRRQVTRHDCLLSLPGDEDK